jgi:hypothetical protein
MFSRSACWRDIVCIGGTDFISSKMKLLVRVVVSLRMMPCSSRLLTAALCISCPTRRIAPVYNLTLFSLIGPRLSKHATMRFSCAACCGFTSLLDVPRCVITVTPTSLVPSTRELCRFRIVSSPVEDCVTANAKWNIAGESSFVKPKDIIMTFQARSTAKNMRPNFCEMYGAAWPVMTV